MFEQSLIILTRLIFALGIIVHKNHEVVDISNNGLPNSKKKENREMLMKFLSPILVLIKFAPFHSGMIPYSCVFIKNGINHSIQNYRNLYINA